MIIIKGFTYTNSHAMRRVDKKTKIFPFCEFEECSAVYFAHTNLTDYYVSQPAPRYSKLGVIRF